MPDGIDQWKLDVLKVLGEKATKIEQTPTRGGSPLNNKRVRDPKTVLPTVTMPGKGPPTGRVGKFLGSQLFGSRDDRRSRDPKKVQEIYNMHDKGEAAPVEMTANGRTLKGNFFTAKGHNLKSEDFKPDTSRPVVLLLTGSGGSCEDQGLDMAKMYKEGGASVLSVNFGGYGDSSDSEVSEQSLNQDGQAMLEYLVGLGYDPDKIVLHGYSMGATVSGQLEGMYEKNGVKFRGQVQDRPMPSAYDGVMGHLGNLGPLPGTIAKKELGSMSGKKALAESDKTTPKVVTTDNKGEFARRGEMHREGLKQGGHNVTGQQSTGGHFDHDKMIEANKDDLLNLVRKDRTGQVDPNVSSDVLDTQVIFEDTIKQITSAAGGIYSLVTKGVEKKDVKSLDDAMTKVGEVATMIDQLYSTGLDKLKEFKPRFLMLDNWTKKLDGYRDTIRKAMKDATGSDPYAEKELVRIASQIAQLNYDFRAAGGAKEENSALEDKVFEMIKQVQNLMSNISDRQKFGRANPDLIEAVKELSANLKLILASRNERTRALKDSTANLKNLTANPSKLATNAKAEVGKEMEADFKKLEAEDEDVSAKRIIGRSVDKGFKDAVEKPVAKILPKIRTLMEQGKKIDKVTLPELEGVKNGLNTALQLYTQKRNETDQRKNPKDWEQRDKKVKAIQERLTGLNGLIDKANNMADKIEQKMLAGKDQSIDDLKKSGGIDQMKMLTKNLHGGVFANTGDTNADEATKKSSIESAQQASKYILSCDKFQRDELLKSGLDPKGLSLVLLKMGDSNSQEVLADAIFDALGDDPDKMEAVLNSGAEASFALVGSGDKPLRGNSVISKLQVKYAMSQGGDQLCEEGNKEFLNGVKNQDLEIKPDIEKNPQKLANNIATHIAVFRKGLTTLLKQAPPPAMARVASTIYASAIQKYGDQAGALEYVGGFVVLRVLAPKMVSADFGTDVKGKKAAIIQSKILQNLANNKHFKEPEMKPFDKLIDELAPKMQEYLKAYVQDGDAHNEGLGPQDLAIAALSNRTAVNSEFADPGPDDPLGTEPISPSTMLGRAIAVKRDLRDRSYDWDDLLQLQSNNKAAFEDMLYMERREVLDLVAAM